MSYEFLISAFVTLVVVVDPVGLVPGFLALTEKLPGPARRSVGLRAAVIAFGILVGAALIGDWLLRTLGISINAFRIAGGLLLFSIATEMVFGVRVARQSQTAEQAVEEHVSNIAAFPLAIPMLAGPGAITATVLLAGRAGSLTNLSALIAVVALVCVIAAAAFLLADRIRRYFGITGNVVLSRLLGVLLASLAVQFVIDGVKALF